MLYRVVRMYQDSRFPKRAVRGLTGLYLEEAQAHCRNPESSSRTATSAAARRRTRERGPWFDGYEADK